MTSFSDIVPVLLKNLHPLPVMKQWKIDMSVPKHTEKQQSRPSMKSPKQSLLCNTKKGSKFGSKRNTCHSLTHPPNLHPNVMDLSKY
jgi:hypothetical protein